MPAPLTGIGELTPLDLGGPLGGADPYRCGGGFAGSISGGLGPYTVTYQLSGTSETLLRHHELIGGNFETPDDFIDYDTLVAGSYDITVTLRDQTGRAVSLYYPSIVISDRCDTAGPTATTPDSIALPADHIAFTGSSHSSSLAMVGLLAMSVGFATIAHRRRLQRR